MDRPENKCIDGTCLVDKCKVCQLEGPPVCDSCEDGYILIDGLCKEPDCQDGFEYNFISKECEDKICKVDNCWLCEKDGLETCDRCKENFWLTGQNTCIDATCSDPGCGLCNTEGPSVCNFCKSDYHMTENKICKSKICPNGFGWNDATASCEDVTCNIEHCINCEFGGVDTCD